MDLSASKKLTLFAVSSVSLLTFLFGFILQPQIFDSILTSQLTIKKGTASYKAFVGTPMPTLTKFYFFDMLNPRELFHRQEKPILEERGPYTFRESQRKVNIRWHPNGTVSYQKEKFWYFERELSVGDLSDVITTINVPVVGSAEHARGNYFMEWGISDILSSLEATLFVKRTVRELLFEGYEDTMMDISSSFADTEEDEYFDEDKEDNDDNDSDKIVLDKFGWFYKRNGTSWSDGDIEMRTGEGDVDRLGEIVTWNNKSRTEAFEGECGQVRGSSDGLYPPGLADIKDSLAFYSTDLCRPLHFTKSGLNSIHGIPVTTFHLDPANFANTSHCPGNVCYNNNLPTGVQNVTQCKMKSPTFVSRPHFYQADQSYLRQFQYGLSPDPQKHESVFMIEPMSSIPLKVEMRLQLNVFVRKVEGIEYLFKDLQDLMFPAFWFESLTELPEEMSGPINMLIMLPTIMKGCAIIGLLTSLTIILSVAYCQVSERRRQNEKLRSIVSSGKGGTGVQSPGYHYSQVPPTDRERRE